MKIDGFRLRNARDWRTARVRNAVDAVGALAGICTARCSFCFEQNLPFNRDRSMLSSREACTRLRYMDLSTGRGIFDSARPHLEPFGNPDAVEILVSMRKRDPESLFVVTTNGSYLTSEVVEKLKAIKPILIKLSLNVADTDKRVRHMGRKSDPAAALGAPSLLREAGIPFLGSIVAGAGISIADMEKAAMFLGEEGAYGIRLRLPYVHRFMPEECSERASEESWNEILEWVDGFAEKVPFAVWAEPSQAWLPPLSPRIDAVIPGSPAQLAGLQRGDVVVRIGTESIGWRDQLRLFVQERSTPALPLEIDVARNGRQYSLAIRSEQIKLSRYPYTEALGHPSERLGIVVLPDVLVANVQRIVGAIEKHNARFSLIFCSPFSTETIERLLSDFPPFEEALTGRSTRVVEIRKPYLGGNSYLFESRFVEDYERALRDLLPQLDAPPDLLVIPQSFGSGWGIDINGRSIHELGHRMGIAVELIPWPLIYGREE